MGCRAEIRGTLVGSTWQVLLESLTARDVDLTEEFLRLSIFRGRDDLFCLGGIFLRESSEGRAKSSGRNRVVGKDAAR